MNALRDEASGERNVGRHDDVVGLGVLDDPVVGGVRALRDDHVADHRVARWPQAAVRDDHHGQAVPLGDAERLGFHRAGVAIDEEADSSGLVVTHSGSPGPVSVP